ncbi:hypothetical protein BOKEGFJH_00929 [Chlamydia avium]|nr:hypothetical protein BOKEGFJH_00929 [Chlamydia avium]
MSSSNQLSPQDSTSHREKPSPTLKIFDPLRHKILVSTPEEEVRQKLIAFLIKDLHYPPNSFIIEKGLATLSPLLQKKHTFYSKKHRLDLLVTTPITYTNAEGKIYNLGKPHPLLLIECKAHAINQRTLNQLLSYNYIIGAPCLSIVCYNKQKTGFLNPQTHLFDFYPGLPSYSQLLTYYLHLKHTV